MLIAIVPRRASGPRSLPPQASAHPVRPRALPRVRSGRTPLHLACVMADQPAHLSRGRQHVEIAKYLIEAGAITSTPDKYHRVPLSYLPQSAKSLRLYTPKVSEPTAVWAIEEVTPGCAVPDGSVAQSSAIHLLRP